MKLKLGNISSKRDFTFVDDTVNGFIATINKKTIGQVINLGTGYEFSIKDVINFASELLNKKIKVKKIMRGLDQKKVKFQDFFQITKKQKNFKMEAKIYWQKRI